MVEEHALDSLLETTGEGVKLDPSCIEAIIEGVVKKLKGKPKEGAADTPIPGR
jgi:hypothetical protein